MARDARRSEAVFSERGFHDWLARRLGRPKHSLLPLGDDTAAVRVGGRRVALLTTDAFVEGTHFWKESPPRAVGAAVAAASLSDLAAKGGEPVGLLLDLLLPARVARAWPRNIVLGAEAEAARFGAHVIGGDTKQSPIRSVVGTMLGWGEASRLPARSGARPKDLLVTTGTVGRGGLAAARLRGGQRTTEAARHDLLRIQPRVREGSLLAKVAHAMIDTSDGIAEAGHLLSEASHCRLILRAESLPLEPGLRRPNRSEVALWDAAFYGGDYELLASVAPSSVPQLRRGLAALGSPLTVVGTVARGRGAYLEVNGRLQPLPHAGWDPFGSPLG